MAYLTSTRYGLRNVGPGEWEHPASGMRAIRQPDGFWRVAVVATEGPFEGCLVIPSDREFSSLRGAARRIREAAA